METPTTVTTKQLIKLLPIAMPKKIVLPILESVLLENDAVTATDLDVSIRLPYRSGITAPYPFKEFKTLLTEFDSGKYEYIDNKVTFVSGKEKVAREVDSPGDFPKIRREMPDTLGFISPATISDMMVAKEFVGNDDLRPILSTIAISTHTVSTDAHRLFFKKLREPLKVTEPILFPVKVVKMLEIIGGEFTLSRNARQNNEGPYFYMLKQGEIEITWREIEGKYPNWKAVIPKADKKIIISSSEELQKKINKASKFWLPVTKQIIFDFNREGGMSFMRTFNNETGGSYSTDIDATGDALTIGFNGQFMLDILNHVEGKVTIGAISNSKGVLINKYFLLMPVMLNDDVIKEMQA